MEVITMARIDGRANDQLRPIEIIPNFNKFAEGSCLIRCGNTQVLCCASVEERTPPHVPEGEGWVTAEYSMLPRHCQVKAVPPLRGDPAAGRPLSPGLCGHEEAGGAHHHRGLRCTPG